MDPIARMVAAGAAGAAGGSEPGLYVDDLFSTFLYEGTSSNQSINNGIRLGNAITSLRAYSMYATQGTNYTSIVPSGATFQEAITNGAISGSNDDFLYSGGSVLDIYVDLVDAAVATAVKFGPQGDVGSNVVYNTPSSLTIYGSNDASSWTTLDTNTGISSGNFTAGSFTTFSFSNSTAYRYYRIAAPAGTSISEWELVATSETAGEGGLVWLKNRNSNGDHWLFDTERGPTKGLRITTDGEYTLSDYFSSFDAGGFTVGSNGSTNYDTLTYASWSFRKAPGFFDVVTYTGSGSAQTISHNLGSVPGMIIVHRVNHNGTQAGGTWPVWHRSISTNTGSRLLLNEATEAQGSSTFGTTMTSTEFSVGTSPDTNNSGSTYVAYIFGHDDQSFGTSGAESIIKCGSYTGNSSESGNVIDLGFEPQWLMIKRTTNSDPWLIWDVMRGMANGSQDPYLRPNLNNAEDVFAGVNVLPTGFELASSTGFQNSSGENYIYMAIRRPHKPPTAGTEVFAVQTNSPEQTRWTPGFPPDVLFSTKPLANTHKIIGARLTGAQSTMTTTSWSAESTGTNYLNWDDPTGTITQTYFQSQNDLGLHYAFKRAPGFMDVISYTGDGTINRTIPHNLGVSPELVIIKRRSQMGNWWVDAPGIIGSGKYMYLERNNAVGPSSGTYSAFGTHTATTIGLETVQNNDTNHNTSTHVAYLFASQPGVSKVGSYSGTGSNINVDCGFTAGARFVLIKRTDSSGDWHVWDTERGIVSGNEPFMYLNEPARAQVTGNDYIDPLNAGFTVTSSAPADLNASGGTYLFLAIS